MCWNLLVFILSFSFATSFASLITPEKAPLESPVPVSPSDRNSSRIKNGDLPTPVASATVPALGSEKAPRFWGSGVKSDSEVVELFGKFRDAVAISDKETVAALMKYPLRVNFPTDSDSKQYTFVRNRRSFVRLYNRIFDEKLRTFISEVDPETDDIWGRPDGIAIGRGVIWIGAFCDDRKCSGPYRLAFRTIHANSNLMNLE
jgi:hypothetical protein